MSTRTTFTAPCILDLRRSLGPVRRGTGDPCLKINEREVWRATRTPEGPGTIHLVADGRTITGEAWGDGADWLLTQAPDFLGCNDDPSGFDPSLHPFVADAHHRLPGLRIGRTASVVEAAVPSVCEQKVTGFEAHRSWRQIVRRFGEPAPGPEDLWVPPAAAVLASIPYYDMHVVGLERKRADTVRRVTAQGRRLEALTDGPTQGLTDRLTAIAGVGAWTAAEVARVAMGDPDAVSVGDYHLPTQVCLTLAGETDGTDERMVELLEPFRGHRARVVQLVLALGQNRPRRGPRRSPHSIAAI